MKLPDCLLICCTIFVLQTTAEKTTCDSARRNCIRRFGCSTMIRNLHLNCAQLYNQYARVRTCPYLCVKALAVFLMSTKTDPLNANLLNCSCERDQKCEKSRSRLHQLCYKETIKEIRTMEKNLNKPSCLFAHWLCVADNRCQIALHYYVKGCRKLWRPGKGRKPRCTRRCRNSLLVLSSIASARYLQSCECVSSEEPMMTYITQGTLCKEMQKTTDMYCPKYFLRYRRYHGNGKHKQRHQRRKNKKVDG